MEITVIPSGWVIWEGIRERCALGRSGVTRDKKEGDGATPVGRFPLRRVYFRADRLDPPVTRLPIVPICRHDGWCDAPADPAYNRLVRLPHAARCEAMWREDRVYDLMVVLGHNDDPVVPGAGSAIFLHLARRNYAPTEGCVAIHRPPLLKLLAACGPETTIAIGL